MFNCMVKLGVWLWQLTLANEKKKPSQKQRKYFNASMNRYEYKYKQDLHFLVKKAAAFCFQIRTRLSRFMQSA